MKIDSIKFKGHRCFKNDWVGFDEIKAINVIIGRNNSGKSHILDVIRKCCYWSLDFNGAKFKCNTVLNQRELQNHFSGNHMNGELSGNHWANHGQKLVGQEVEWKVDSNGHISELRTTRSDYIDPENQHQYYVPYSTKVSKIVPRARHDLDGKMFRRLLADRDLVPEAATEKMHLSNEGLGATNIIRRFLTSSDPKFPRDLIQGELLNGLNLIFGEDGKFTELTVQFHDYEGVEQRNVWEIFLGEQHKGIVSLSKSGSGLKTVILVLLNLLVIPHIEEQDRSNYVFALEELENNLHPALLRRLFQFIEQYAKKHGAKFFLTTHSSVALDFFGLSDEAQIILVKHDGESATASTVSAHFDKIEVISELGAKPSDILQANGIIWVEGPSDRIYINRWIELLSNGELQEGRDYQCAFYGGALLATTEFKSDEERDADQNRINLLKLNNNVFVVCDGDRATNTTKLKDRALRISEEVAKIPNAGFWATNGREIENYCPGTVIALAHDLDSNPDSPGQFQSFFHRKRQRKLSFIEEHLKVKSVDKTQFAIGCAKHMTVENMKDRFEWEEKVTEIVDAIRKWNA
tara:strand:+ start:3884 stop:5617 length:1734 start_codon:yes stop_codon:yes gene_type:complete